MDVSKYSFECQKVFHIGLRYAKSFNHDKLEVEHVALALLKADDSILPTGKNQQIAKKLQNHLESLPRIFGIVKIEFGSRLIHAMNRLENDKDITIKPIELKRLWEVLVTFSTTLKIIIAKEKEKFDADIRECRGEENSPECQKQNNSRDDEQSEEIPRPRRIDKKLRNYTVDFTELAERGEIDPVVGRDLEVKRVLEILSRKKKNNPILLGEPGVGKTAIAEALALRVVAGSVPDALKGTRILALDLGSMLAGAKFRGEFEDRLKGVLRSIIELQGSAVLFIDEIHMLIGAGNHEGGADAANLLKPALSKGDLRCIGATTFDEYSRLFEKDRALARRFQKVIIEEPDPIVCLSILRGIKQKYEIFHGVKVEDGALNTAIDLSIRYLTDRKLPDKAIDLLDEACARMRLQIESVPHSLDILRSKVSQLEIEKKALTDIPNNIRAMFKLNTQLSKIKAECAEIEEVWRAHQNQFEAFRKAEAHLDELQELYKSARDKGDFEFAGRLQYFEIPEAKKAFDSISENLQKLHKQHEFLCQSVGEYQICEIVADLSGIPVGRLLESEFQKIANLADRLHKRVFGQEEAIDKIVRALKRSRVGISDSNRPIGVFLLMGPTGVGKTETAKAVAKELFDDESRLIRIDMSEYMEKHNVARLIGSPPGYIGYGDGGELAEAVRRKPYHVILMDEIEKAHPKILDILLQIFEDGRLTDGRGRLIDFRNTLIILTSNIAVQKLSSDKSVNAEETLRKTLIAYFKPEFINRIDEVVIYSKLKRSHLESLIDRFTVDLNNKLISRNMKITLGHSLKAELISAGFDGEFGGRAIRRHFQTMVVDHLAERILNHPTQCSGSWVINYDHERGFFWQAENITHKYLKSSTSQD